MTGRTFTAGAPPATSSPSLERGFVSSGDPRHAAFEEALKQRMKEYTPERQFWDVIERLWRLGGERYRLSQKIKRINAQLDDPALAGHPKRAEAEWRYLMWRGEIALLDGKAERVQAQIAKRWDAFPARKRDALRREIHWSQSVSGRGIAADFWAKAKAWGPYPGQEHGF